MYGIAHGGEHHTAGMRVFEFHFAVRQCAVGGCLHHGQQVALQQGQHHLGFRIAEPAVVFYHFRSVLGEHQAEIQAAAEFPAFRLHRPDGRQENGFHAGLCNLFRVEGIRRDSAHAAGVRAVVSVLRPLMVHAGYHRLYSRTVRESQHGYFGSFKEFFNDDLIAAFAKLLVFHDLPHGFARFPAVHGHGHALAQGQAVRLDYRRNRRGFQVFQRLFRIGEYFIGRGGNPVLLHQVLGEDLASLNDRRVFPGTEAGNAHRLQGIHTTQHQRIIRSHNRIINLCGFGKSHDSINIRSLDIHTGCVRRDPAVSRQGINGFDFRVLPQFLDNGMLTAAAADKKNIHNLLLIPFRKVFRLIDSSMKHEAVPPD